MVQFERICHKDRTWHTHEHSIAIILEDIAKKKEVQTKLLGGGQGHDMVPV